ncbi:MAG: hypothetical protein Q9173_005378 [Seirophora scorigena]
MECDHSTYSWPFPDHHRSTVEKIALSFYADGGGILNSIAACAAGASLEELYLDASTTASLTAIGSFGALERLKKLRISDVLLTGKADKGQKGDGFLPEPKDLALQPEQGFGIWGHMPTLLEELTVMFAEGCRKGWRRLDAVFDDIGGVKERLLPRSRKVQAT